MKCAELGGRSLACHFEPIRRKEHPCKQCLTQIERLARMARITGGFMKLCRTEILGVLCWNKRRNDHPSVNVTTLNAMIAFTCGTLHAILIYQE